MTALNEEIMTAEIMHLHHWFKRADCGLTRHALSENAKVAPEMSDPSTDSQIGDRLKQIRELRGYKTASDAARALGFTVSTYIGHENGSRLPGRRAILQYADAFQTSAEWLTYGAGDPNETSDARMPIGGVVTGPRYARIFAFDPEPFDLGSLPDQLSRKTVERPAGSNDSTVALYCVGGPETGWILYVDLNAASDADISELRGELCLVMINPARTNREFPAETIYPGAVNNLRVLQVTGMGSAEGAGALLYHPTLHRPITAVLDWARPIRWIRP